MNFSIIVTLNNFKAICISLNNNYSMVSIQSQIISGSNCIKELFSKFNGIIFRRIVSIRIRIIISKDILIYHKPKSCTSTYPGIISNLKAQLIIAWHTLRIFALERINQFSYIFGCNSLSISKSCPRIQSVILATIVEPIIKFNITVINILATIRCYKVKCSLKNCTSLGTSHQSITIKRTLNINACNNSIIIN